MISIHKLTNLQVNVNLILFSISLFKYFLLVMFLYSSHRNHKLIRLPHACKLKSHTRLCGQVRVIRLIFNCEVDQSRPVTNELKFSGLLDPSIRSRYEPRTRRPSLLTSRRGCSRNCCLHGARRTAQRPKKIQFIRLKYARPLPSLTLSSLAAEDCIISAQTPHDSNLTAL